jgi:hypothetical protein
MKKRFYMPLGIAFLITACAGPFDNGNLIGPAGGAVFYDKGSYSNGWRYLECVQENAGRASWADAKKLCDDYSLGGYDGWRLPSREELKKLIGVYRGFVVNQGVYWSSEESDSSAWGIENGEKNKLQDPALYGKDEKFFAWPVREF